VINEIEQTATAFANARQQARGLESYPGTIPVSLPQAYQVQDQIVAKMARPIAGWKVGRILGAQSATLGADRLAGPIFDDHIYYVGTGEDVSVPVYAEGFSAAEAEFMMRIGTTPDPAKLSYTLAEAAAMIDDVRVGIEIASSPFAGINDNGATVTAADLGNSKALVIGKALSLPADSDFATWPILAEIDGVQVGEAVATGLPDGPIGAVRFLLENLAGRGIELHKGQWISTGAITGVHIIRVGQKVRAQFGDKYTVQCKTKAALPV